MVASREIRTPDQIREIIREELEKQCECGSGYFGGVFWEVPDDTDCNWQMSVIAGKEWQVCYDKIKPYFFELRQKYNIPDEVDGTFLNGLRELGNNPTAVIFSDVAIWLKNRGFAIASIASAQNGGSGLEITLKGRSWLAMLDKEKYESPFHS